MVKDKKISLKNDLGIVIYILKKAHKISKTYIPILFLSSIFKAMTPFINIIMPKFIIDELLGKQRIEVFISLVSIIIVGNFIFNFINRWLDSLVNIKNMEILNGFDLLIGEKIMDMDFEKIEDPQILDLKERAIYPLKNQGILQRIIKNIVDIISNVITIIGLVAVISILNPLIVLLIIGIVFLNSFVYKRSQAIQYELHKELIPINRKWAYFAELTCDFSIGKDSRLYNMEPLIINKLENFNNESIGIFSKLFITQSKYEGINEINLQIQMTIVYAYMAYKVFINSIGIGAFTMYINAANNFSKAVSDFLKNYIELMQMCRYIDVYRDFESIESNRDKTLGSIGTIQEYDIEFKNVYFKYPRSNEYTLKNVSIKIDSGEKLSVVGLNGAGKTTFIKLLTRLYEPTEGEILLNRVNIKNYDYDEYMKLLSVVFQDFKLMAFSIKENIAFEKHKEISDENIIKILNEVGLENDILKLPKGINTSIYKTFDKDGIEFSGGQAQKLAIARAVYKDAPIVILDEPTAALDPIAEFEIYSRFNQLIGNKTSIYISHRLSSCKFCDKIAVFHNGEIIEYGNHNDLVKNIGSEYETMYMAQAQYYA